MKRRFTAAAMSLALSTTLAVHTAGTAQAAEASPSGSQALASTEALKRVTEAPDVASAQLAAKLSGRRVEAVSERAGDATTFANPDGTLTTEVSSGPVRVQEEGKWKRLDTTLVDTGQQLEPKTAVADVTLSDGGSEDFATVARGARSFGLDWGKVSGASPGR
ncbi:hypothetical protein [Streptomyces sp. NPDC055287]